MVRALVETERKYEAGESAAGSVTGGALDLEGLPSVARTDRLAPVVLDAVYYDTADLALAAHRSTLRRRTGGTDAGWHLKRPTDRPDTRTELHASLGRTTGKPPKALRAEVAALTRGRPLLPIVRLHTTRTLTLLLDAAGRTLAEIAYDEVRAERLAPPGERGARAAGDGSVHGTGTAAGPGGGSAQGTGTAAGLGDGSAQGTGTVVEAGAGSAAGPGDGSAHGAGPGGGSARGAGTAAEAGAGSVAEEGDGSARGTGTAAGAGAGSAVGPGGRAAFAGGSVWAEIEVELHAGDDALLDAVEERLLAAGLRRSASASKLARALGDRRPTPLPAPPAVPRTAGETATGYLHAQLTAILALDPAVRRADEDAVHRMRVATRRARSAFRSFDRQLGRPSTDPLGAELKWLAEVLGAERDREVLAERLTLRLTELAPTWPESAGGAPTLTRGPVGGSGQPGPVSAGGGAEDAERPGHVPADGGAEDSGQPGPVTVADVVAHGGVLPFGPDVPRRLREAASVQGSGSTHAAVVAVLDGARYFALLDDLEALLASPPYLLGAGADAGVAVAGVVGRDHRRLRRRVDTALDLPPGEGRDVGLHEARKAAKRARYSAEAAEPVLGVRARAQTGRMKAVQQLLGEHQDSVMCRAAVTALRAEAVAAGEDPAPYDAIVRAERERAARVEARLPEAWSAADQPV